MEDTGVMAGMGAMGDMEVMEDMEDTVEVMADTVADTVADMEVMVEVMEDMEDTDIKVVEMAILLVYVVYIYNPEYENPKDLHQYISTILFPSETIPCTPLLIFF